MNDFVQKCAAALKLESLKHEYDNWIPKSKSKLYDYDQTLGIASLHQYYMDPKEERFFGRLYRSRRNTSQRRCWRQDTTKIQHTGPWTTCCKQLQRESFQIQFSSECLPRQVMRITFTRASLTPSNIFSVSIQESKGHFRCRTSYN